MLLEAGWALGFSLIVTVNLIWQAEVAALTPLQLVLVGTVLELTALLGEVPTGVVADVYSRRLSIVIGMIMMGAGFLIEGLFPTFEAILVANVVWGLGATFLSGARQAWIADEVGEQAVAPLYLRGAQVGQLATFAAIPFSVGLATIQLNVPILSGALLLIAIGVVLAAVMPESGFQRQHTPELSAAGSMAATLRDGLRVVRGSPMLLGLLLVAATLGMASEGFDRLWTPHILRDIGLPSVAGLDPVVWFGVLRAGGLLLALAATEYIRCSVDLTNARLAARALLVSDALQIVGVLAFALTGNFVVAMAAFWAVPRLAQPAARVSFSRHRHLDERPDGRARSDRRRSHRRPDRQRFPAVRHRRDGRGARAGALLLYPHRALASEPLAGDPELRDPARRCSPTSPRLRRSAATRPLVQLVVDVVIGRERLDFVHDRPAAARAAAKPLTP